MLYEEIINKYLHILRENAKLLVSLEGDEWFKGTDPMLIIYGKCDRPVEEGSAKAEEEEEVLCEGGVKLRLLALPGDINRMKLLGDLVEKYTGLDLESSYIAGEGPEVEFVFEEPGWSIINEIEDIAQSLYYEIKYPFDRVSAMIMLILGEDDIVDVSLAFKFCVKREEWDDLVENISYLLRVVRIIEDKLKIGKREFKKDVDVFYHRDTICLGCMDCVMISKSVTEIKPFG